MPDSSSGAAVGRGHQPFDHLGAARQQQHPADDPVQLVQPELEAGGHPEVAATTPDRPEQVGMAVGVGVQHPPVGGDQLGREQIVDGQAVLSDQEPDPAAQGHPADPDRAGVAEPGGQPVGADGGGVGTGGQPALGPGGAPPGVDVQGRHPRQVEHDPAVAGAVPGQAVPAAAHRQLHPGLGGQRHDPRHLGGVGRPHHGRRPPVELAVEHLAGLVVAGVAGSDNPPVEAVAEPGDRDGGGGREGHENSLQHVSR